MQLFETFKAGRMVGTPGFAIATPDPVATISLLRAKGIAADKVPIVIWDCNRGWRSGSPEAAKLGTTQYDVNKDLGELAIRLAINFDPSADRPQSKQDLAKRVSEEDVINKTSNPIECINRAMYLPPKTVLFLHQANRYLDPMGNAVLAAMFTQGIASLRDPFKATLRSLVLLGPDFKLPPEIANDILLLDEALPTAEELTVVVKEIWGAAAGSSAAAAKKLTPELLERSVDALRGLAVFPAEQAVAMCIKGDPPETIDTDMVWERKRRMISATPGLKVERGTQRLDSIGGNNSLKAYLRQILTSKTRPRAILFIDEIEKALAGATGAVGDSSGVTQGFLGAMLTYQQEANDKGSMGLILVGPPGTGKSALALAAGNEAEIPTIMMDLGGMKASLVGESESRLRNALKVVDAVSGGRFLAIATCNKIAVLPPELRRRYTAGTFFCDLPDADEREVIWNMYIKKYNINMKGNQLPVSIGWTGAEIKQACFLTDSLGLESLAETQAYIVPVGVSAAAQIKELREQAHNKFLSASVPGFYQMSIEEAMAVPPPPKTRARAKKEEV